MSTIPDFLRPFENDLKPYQREYIKIEAETLDCPLLEDPLELDQSKFLGFPFLPANLDYPSDMNGNPMILVAQLNFTEIPELKDFPKKGLLQFFLPPENWYDAESKVIFYEPELLKSIPVTDFSFIREKHYEDLPFERIHQLSFSKQTEHGGLEDVQFDFLFGGLEWWDFEDSLNEEDQLAFNMYFESSGHKIGGYAEFTQSDPRGYDSEKKNDIQLLQIDSDDFIMFGDVGLGHWFIKKEDLIRRNFEKAYFYWDCC